MNQAIVAMVVSAIGVASIAGAQAQSLEQALVSAYLTNPQLEAQRAALRATDELVPQALSGWRPSVTAEGATIFNDTDRSGNQSDTFTTLQSSLAVDQEIYSGGETVANTRRAERLVRVERARLMVVEQQVLLDAVTVYTDLLAARAVLDCRRPRIASTLVRSRGPTSLSPMRGSPARLRTGSRRRARSPRRLHPTGV
jgi:outer membrane protein